MTAALLAGCGSSAPAETAASEAPAAEASEAPAEEEASEEPAEEASEEAPAEDAGGAVDGDTVTLDQIKLGETGTDITATVKFIYHRTDMAADDYPGKNMAAYVADFNKLYPNITIEYDLITDFAQDALNRLSAGTDWGDVMGIPAVDKADLSTYFTSYGDEATVASEVNYTGTWNYDGQCYGIPTTANANGIVYNKKVFEEAGVTEIPKTPDEFIDALQKIKDNTDAIPLYTNYAAGWTMGAWDAYISGTATGDADYMNNKLIHTKDPFAKQGDGTTGPYAVYKILFDATEKGLIEDDYTTTDWEGCKPMMNNGEIATLVLGSWAVTQMQGAGEHPDDVGYMPFPITIDGKQYASAGPDYCLGVNVADTGDQRLAAMIWAKWYCLESGFSANEGGLPIKAGDTNYPAVYDEFTAANVTYVVDNPAPADEADLPNEMNAESELAINNGGNDKIQHIVEHAHDGDEAFDDIMAEWNQKWSDAQDALGVEVNQ